MIDPAKATAMVETLAEFVLWGEPAPEWAEEYHRQEDGTFGGSHYSDDIVDAFEELVKQARTITGKEI